MSSAAANALPAEVSVGETLVKAVLLLFHSFLFLVVVGGGNVVGGFIMMIASGHGLPKVVTRCILASLTIPFGFLVLLAAPLLFVPAINRAAYAALGWMLTVYQPFQNVPA